MLNLFGFNFLKRFGKDFHGVARNVCGLFVILASVLAFAGYGEATPYFIKQNGSGNGSGLSSWENAGGLDKLKTLMGAGNGKAESGDTVYVAKGTYNLTETLTLNKGVKVYGGFVGDEVINDSNSADVIANRDITLNKTIISRDASLGDDNKFSLIKCSGNGATSQDTRLDGFTLTGGKADLGGAMYISNASPTITNCTFNDNKANGNGGAMYIYNASPAITNCTFTGNNTNGGGGAMVISNASPAIENCSFNGNKANGSGGAMYIYDNASPAITNCTFTGNNTNGNGGAMVISNASPAITNCTLTGNKANNNGDEIYVSNNGTANLVNTIVNGSIGIYNENGTINATNCALSSWYGITNTVGDKLSIVGWTPVSRDVTVNGVKHTVFIPYPDFIGKGKGGDNIPAADQLGRMRNTSNPTIGALEVVYFVTTEGNASNDGLSWNSPTDLETAVKNGGVIFVAMGTYERDKTLTLKKGVKLYGGFAGNETITGETIASRDITLNKTIISRDASATGKFSLITCKNNGATSQDTRLDGFTLTGGKANYGGAIFIDDDASPTITNCTFTGNTAYDGGGAMFIFVNASPTITNCTFNGNYANGGGAMAIFDNASPAITNCTFNGNSASYNGGAIYIDNASPAITNCAFTGNSANGNEADSGGGAMYIHTNASPTITNCTFNDNEANTIGGAMYIFNNANPAITNCTLTGNTANNGGGVLVSDDCSVNLSGDIVINGNTDGNNAPSNIVLGKNSKLNITGTLGGDSPIGVDTSETVTAFVFTSGLKNRGGADNFKSDRDQDYAITLNTDGEAQLTIRRTVTFNGNGGTGADYTQKLPNGCTDKLLQNSFTREGYSFNGWNTKADGTGTAYADGQEVTVTDDMTLYAGWTPITYSINYTLNEGTNHSDNPASYTIESATITLKNPTKTGYEFEKWTSGDKTVTEIPKGSVGNRKFTANWKIKQYTLTFNTNGGTEISPITQDYGSDITAPSAPTKTGYSFMGWDNEIPSKMPAENQTFTANWKAIEYKISFNPNGGEYGTNQGNPTSYDIESENFSPSNPTREGYEFVGWLLSGDKTGAVSKDLTVLNGSTGDREYIAQWELHVYTLSYDLDGGTVSPDNPAGYTIESDNIKLNNPTKNGYNFMGWSGSADIATSMDVTITKGSTGNRSYTATWQEEYKPAPVKPAPELTASTESLTVKKGGTISAIKITATQGENITWTTSGKLPNGLTGNGNVGEFTISGTVSHDAEATTYKYTVIASNDAGTASKEISITVTGGGNVDPTPTPDPVTPDEPTPEPVETTVDKILETTSEDLKEEYKDTKNIALTLTEEVTNEQLSEVLEKFEEAGVEVKTLDLSQTTGLTEVKLNANTSIENLKISGNESIKTVEVTDNATLKTLDLTGSSVTKVEASGCEKLETVNVEGSKTLKELDVSETKITELNVKNCAKLEVVKANSCGELEEVNLEGCESLKELDVSQTAVVALNAQNCENLETLNCASCDIRNLNIDGCRKLKVVKCNNNSLTRFNAYMFVLLQKLECSNQHVTGFILTRYFNIRDLFNGGMNVSTADDPEPETDTGDVANVKDIKAYDENGNEIPVTFNDETGEVTFAQEPATITYNYITGFNDVIMDVTVSASDSADVEIDGANGSGGGCLLVRSEGLGVRSVLILALFLLCFVEVRLIKKSGVKKP